MSSSSVILASALLVLSSARNGQAQNNSAAQKSAANFYITTPQTGDHKPAGNAAVRPAAKRQIATAIASNTTVASRKPRTQAPAQLQTRAATNQTARAVRQPRRANYIRNTTPTRQPSRVATTQRSNTRAATTSYLTQAQTANYYASSNRATRQTATRSRQTSYYTPTTQQTTNQAYVASASYGKRGLISNLLHRSHQQVHQVSAAPARAYQAIKYRASKLAGHSQKGVASWYGSDFDGGDTASGETYDMNSMTAAHKNLPFGTIVRVKNERNGRECTVRINNRGPYIKGRILDVSKAAARKLDMIGSGVAKISMQVVGRT